MKQLKLEDIEQFNLDTDDKVNNVVTFIAGVLSQQAIYQYSAKHNAYTNIRGHYKVDYLKMLIRQGLIVVA